MLAQGEPLIQYGWTPYEKEYHVKRQRQVQREAAVKTQGKHSHLQARGCLLEATRARREAWNRFSLVAFRSNQPCQHLDLGPQASRTVRQ